MGLGLFAMVLAFSTGARAVDAGRPDAGSDGSEAGAAGAPDQFSLDAAPARSGLAPSGVGPAPVTSAVAETPVATADILAVSPSPQPWQAGFQATYLWQYHPGFSAPYDGPHSLLPIAERGYTLSATLFLGWRLGRNTEIYVNPEVIQSEELSELHGLGGFSNSENQKTGSPQATLYLARAFVRQTIPLGGQWWRATAGPNQVAGAISSRRLVVTLGRVALIDIFDNNAYAHDGRTQFMNWAFMTHAASDYAADARGYTWGVALEGYWDAWVLRAGRFAQAKDSNGLAMDFRLWRHYGDNLEIEHAHDLFGRPGKLRIMGVHNYARMGAFDDAVAYASQHGGTPALANVRREQSKFAVGVALEQALTFDLGLFARLSWNDGRTETYAFTEVDRSATAGAVLRGRLWRRGEDALGLALALDGISSAHRGYLGRGGLGVFLGDGQLPSYAPERVLEAYYAAAAARGLWVSAGYQWIGNPGYNADRGPVSIFSLRLHAEY